MRVTAIRNSRRVGPPFVDKVGLGDDLPAYAKEADVVVNCLPMTPDTEDTFNAALFAAMKPAAFFVNVGRGGTVDTEALVAALENGEYCRGRPRCHRSRTAARGPPSLDGPNLVITPHFAAWSDEDNERRWLLYRENLRRFVAGEPPAVGGGPGTGILKHRVHPGADLDQRKCDETEIDDVAGVFTDLNTVPHRKEPSNREKDPAGKIVERFVQGDGDTEGKFSVLSFEFSDGADPSIATGSASASAARVQRQRQRQ